MSEIMADNYNSQVRRIKQVDKLGGIKQEWAATRYKGMMLLIVKRKLPLPRLGKQRENCSKLVISDKHGDIVAFGDNSLYVKMPL